MSFSFDEFEEVANKLAESDDEGSIRSAISRGYYCIFHRAKKISGFTTNQYGATHESVIRKIRENHEITNNNKIAKTLEELKQDRVTADYHSMPPSQVVFNKNYFKRFKIRFDNLSSMLEQAFHE